VEGDQAPRRRQVSRHERTGACCLLADHQLPDCCCCCLLLPAAACSCCCLLLLSRCCHTAASRAGTKNHPTQLTAKSNGPKPNGRTTQTNQNMFRRRHMPQLQGHQDGDDGCAEGFRSGHPWIGQG
jgi:hypothetical protein